MANFLWQDTEWCRALTGKIEYENLVKFNPLWHGIPNIMHIQTQHTHHTHTLHVYLPGFKINSRLNFSRFEFFVFEINDFSPLELSRDFIKALRKAEYSEFRIFVKFETQNILYFSNIRNYLRQNCVSQNTNLLKNVDFEVKNVHFEVKNVHFEVKMYILRSKIMFLFFFLSFFLPFFLSFFLSRNKIRNKSCHIQIFIFA